MDNTLDVMEKRVHTEIWHITDLALFNIFKYMDINEKKILRQVCPDWLFILDKLYISFRIHSFNTNEIDILTTLGKSTQVIEYARINFNEISLPTIPISENPNFPNTIEYPMIRYLETILDTGNDKHTQARQDLCFYFLKHLCKHTQHLLIEVCCLKGIVYAQWESILGSLNWNFMNKLDIDMLANFNLDGWSSMKNFLIMAKFLEIVKMEHLETFKLSVTHLHENDTPAFENMVSMFTKFILHHEKSLRTLSCHFGNNQIFQNVNGPPDDNQIPLKLIEFNYSANYKHAADISHIAIGILHGVISLTSFTYIENYYNPNSIIYEQLKNILCLNGTTLKFLKLIVKNFNINILRPCLNLTTLDISDLALDSLESSMDILCFNSIKKVILTQENINIDFSNWLVKCCPKLEILDIHEFKQIELNGLSVLQRLKFLARINLHKFLEDQNIENYCENTTGLRFYKKESVTKFIYSACILMNATN